MPTDLELIRFGAKVIGVMDRPRREPQDLALELGQEGDAVRRGHQSQTSIAGGDQRDRRPVDVLALLRDEADETVA